MNPPTTPEYVTGPNGQLGFYDAVGRFIPAAATDKLGNPYVRMGGFGQPTLENKSAFNIYNAPTNPTAAFYGQQVPGISSPSLPTPEEIAAIDQVQQTFNNSSGLPQVTTPTGAAVEKPKLPGMMLNNQQKGALLGLGAAGISALGSTIAPDQYDPRVGMEKPSPIKAMTNLQFTQMGSSFGPAGAAVGFGVDLAKNIVGFAKHKAQYKAAEQKADFTDWRNETMTGMQTDYTGLAREGIEVEMIPVEIERNERVYVKTPTGYQLYTETPNNAPKHEQGGIKTELPQGALVFPKDYFNDLDTVTSRNGMITNSIKFNEIKEKMLKNAKTAALAGKPYSSGGL
jgi:hypothetical protein